MIAHVPLTPELHFLRSCVAAFLQRDQAPSTEILATSELDGDRLIWLARAHRVLPILHQALASSEVHLPFSSARPRQLLNEFFQVNGLRGITQARDLVASWRLLTAAGIEPLVPTPVLLAAQAYGNVALRQSSFSKLYYVVKPAQYDQAVTLLSEAGYDCTQHPLALNTEKNRIHVATSLVPKASDDAMDEVWQTASHVSWGGIAYPVPSDIYWLLLLCHKAEQKQWRVLRAVVDVLIWMQRNTWDWEAVLSTAERFSLTEAVVQAFDLAAVLLDKAPPSYATPHNPADQHAKTERILTHWEQPGDTTDTHSEDTATNELTWLGRYAPTPHEVVQRMLALAEVTAHDTVYDLGCGDGRIVIAAARDYGARGIGIDIDPERIRESRIGAEQAGVAERVTFIEDDTMDVPVHGATVVAVYQQGLHYSRILDKLNREAKPGTRVVSHDFTFPGWIPERVDMVRPSPLSARFMYLWRMP